MIFGLFLAFASYEIGTPKELGPYPKEFRRILTFRTPGEQLSAYANTPCPASQMITGENPEDFGNKVHQMHKNFDSEEWLEKNIYLYV